MTEMVTIYTGNTDGLKSWIKAPGKKRADYPQMPGFPQIPDQDLNELAKYIFSLQK
jgi:cytochrome c